MQRPVAFWSTVGAAVLALASTGCNPEAKRVADHFLQALAHDDWATAFADLHPEARANTLTPDALRTRMEQGGKKLVRWSANCGSSGSLARTGYNVTSTALKTAAAPVRPIVIGVPPLRSGKCNGPMVVELKVDPSLPEKPWRVRSFEWN